MASQVILKKSSVAARVPVVGDLAYGELALNYADGLLYFKKSDGTTIGTIGSASNPLIDNVASWAVTGTFAGVLNPTDVFFKPDGTKMFLLAGTTLNQYTLSTAWDITTAGAVTSFTNTWDTVTNGMFISPDGTKLVTCGQTAVVNAGLGIVASEDRAYYLTLSTPWDITTPTLVSSLKFGAGSAGLPVAETAPHGITFNPNGTIMYMIGTTMDAIYQYTLTTAYDVSTATYSKQISIASVETGGSGIRFNIAGTRMYIIGSTYDNIIEYRLSTAWDTATATYYDDLYITSSEATSQGLYLDETSGNAYIVGTTSDSVTRFKTNSAGILVAPALATGRIDLVGETRIKNASLLVNGNIYSDGSGIFSGNLVSNQITTSTSSITLGGAVTTGNATLAIAQTTGLITIGGVAGTGAITLGQSTAAQTLNLGTGATLAATTKVINIGTAGVSTSITNINLGSDVSGALNTVILNGTVKLPAVGTSGFVKLGTNGQLSADTTAYYSSSNVPPYPAEADTLATVTGRGASTSTAITLSNGTTNLGHATTNYITTSDNGSIIIKTKNQTTRQAGLLNIQTGNTTAAGSWTGAILIKTGDATGGTDAFAGDITMYPGSGDSAGAVVNITGGDSAGGVISVAGAVTIKGGNVTAISTGGTTSGIAGNLYLYGGDVVSASSFTKTSGSVYISGGGASGSGTLNYGSVNIGNTSASSSYGTSVVNIGNSAIATVVNGTVKLPNVGTSGFVKLGTGGQLSADTTTYATGTGTASGTNTGDQISLPNPNAITFATTGGAAAGSTYTGAAVLTVDYSTVGAAPSDHTHSYQAADNDLLAIGGLTGTSGYLKKTAADTWTLDTSVFLTASISDALTLTAGTANGVAYLNGSKVLTTGSALTFDGRVFTVDAPSGNAIVAAKAIVNQAAFLSAVGHGNTQGSTSFDIIQDQSFAYVFNRANTPMLFGVNNAEGMRLTSTGLGIGNSSPTAKLDVTGTAAISGTVTLSGGTANGVAYLNGSKVLTTGSALTFDGTSLGVSRINLGGTTATGTNTGELYLPNSAAIRWRNAAGSGYLNAIYVDGSNNLQLGGGGATNSIIFSAVGAVEVMRVTSTGLGIGTSSPGDKLSVYGDTTGLVSIKVTNNNATGVDKYISMFAGGTNTGIAAWNNSGVVESAVGTNLVFSGYNGTILFQTGTNRTERMRLDASGVLLIGQTATKTSEYLRVSNAGQASMLLDNTGKTNGAFVGVFNDAALFSINRNPSTGFFYNTSNYTAEVIAVGSSSTSYISFATSAAANTIPTERARIDSSGNLGLGVTPSAWTMLKAIEMGTGVFFANNGGAALYIGANAYYNAGWILKSTAAASLYTQSSGVHQWSTAPSGTAGAAVAFTQAMTLDASGNLIIGDTSTSSGLTLVRSGSTTAELKLNQTGTGGRDYRIGSTGSGYGTAGQLIFYDATAGIERARIDSAGVFRVATIQTSGGPVGSFGASKWFTQTEDTVISRTYSCGPNSSTYGNWNIYLATSTGTPLSVLNFLPSATIFGTPTTGAEAARIDSSGNLLVGQTVAGTQKVAWSGFNCGDTTTVAWGNVASTTINLASILPSLRVASGNTLNVTLQIVTSSSPTAASVANILCMRQGDLTWSFTTLGISASNAVVITPTGSGSVITLTFSSGAQYGGSRVQAVSF